MNYADLQAAVCDWIATASGLSPSKVFYTPADSGAAAMASIEPPFCEVHSIIRGRSLGQDEAEFTETQDIYRGERMDILRVQMHGTGAIDYADNTRDGLYDHILIEQARAAGFTIIDIGEASPLNISISGQFVERAVFQMRITYVRTRTVTGSLTPDAYAGTIEHVVIDADLGGDDEEITMTIDGP